MKDLTKYNYKKHFNQHIITVPRYFCEDLVAVHLVSEDILLLPKEEVKERYDFYTGFIRDKNLMRTPSTIML